jgi:hypothetical protein
MKKRIFMATGKQVLTPQDLPQQQDRWTPSRKAVLVELVALQAVTVEQLLGQYPDLSLAEFNEWDSRYRTNSLKGLAVTKTQDAYKKKAA